MDTIDDKLGLQIKFQPFSRRTLFYSLFAFLYEFQFGLGIPIGAGEPEVRSDTGSLKNKVCGRKYK